MKRLSIGILVLALVAVAAALSRPPQPQPELQVKLEERNPWNHLRLNNDPADFQFAIVSDRTGGHRAKIFSLAVEQLNLLQPEFVLSVGDLIEGGKEDPEKMAQEWKEFQSYIARLQMPFFYVPGNHDISNVAMEKYWKEQFGRRYYHFVYRNVLFLLLNSNDPPGKGGHIGEEQIAHCKRVLEENRDVRWTIVVLHHPLWAQVDAKSTGWLEVEKALDGRQYTVFVGHIHRYQKFLRNEQRYYQLATTGGASKIRGIRYNEFDHITWVTMKKDGPLLANILLDGILPEDLKKPKTAETGVSEKNRKPVHTVRGKVLFEGKPIPDAQIVFHPLPAGTRGPRIDALVEEDGTFSLSSYTANDGAPVGEYMVTVIMRKKTEDDKLGPNLLPDTFSKPETTPLRVQVREGVNELSFDLKK